MNISWREYSSDYNTKTSKTSQFLTADMTIIFKTVLCKFFAGFYWLFFFVCFGNDRAGERIKNQVKLFKTFHICWLHAMCECVVKFTRYLKPQSRIPSFKHLNIESKLHWITLNYETSKKLSSKGHWNILIRLLSDFLVHFLLKT